jgi:hypothetical protein
MKTKILCAFGVLMSIVILAFGDNDNRANESFCNDYVGVVMQANRLARDGVPKEKLIERLTTENQTDSRLIEMMTVSINNVYALPDRDLDDVMTSSRNFCMSQY